MKSKLARKLPLPWERFATVFAALGETYRQRVLLLFEPDEELSIKQIADVLPLSRSAVLHHVKVLEAAGLLKRRKEGREVFLRIDTKLLVETLERTLDYARTSL